MFYEGAHERGLGLYHGCLFLIDYALFQSLEYVSMAVAHVLEEKLLEHGHIVDSYVRHEGMGTAVQHRHLLPEGMGEYCGWISSFSFLRP